MALYNKHRPKRFDQLIGSSQKEAARVLQKCLSNSTLQRGIFLHGPTGTGKTTLATILSASLNCEELSCESTSDNSPKLITPGDYEPCGECPSCKDVFENGPSELIDAARDTGIDSMREILRSISMRSFTLDHKVVVFDEMHGLSRQAQDSLLTTLENIPKHVTLIFCTTEPQKVRVTLRTRCLQLGLKMPIRHKILPYLVEIAEKEKMNFSAKGLDERLGYFESIRDAVSQLEVLMSGGTPVEVPDQEEKPEIWLARQLTRGTILDDSNIRDVKDALNKLRRVPSARNAVSEYIHSAILREFGNKGKARDVLRWSKLATIMNKHQEEALPVMFTVDILECFGTNRKLNDSSNSN